MRIVRIELDEVVVPALPDSVNSEEFDRPLHKLASGGRPGWSIQFDALPKTIIQVQLANGVTGLGEFYRDAPQATLRATALRLMGANLAELNLQDLPLARGRWYDGFECALADAYCRSAGIPLYMLLGGAYRKGVRCGFWTGHRTVADAVRKAREGQSRGFDCIKFKCDLADPVAEWCAGIRDACGPGMKVILDPNERFETLPDAVRIARQLEPAGNVLCLEDPLPRWNLAGFRALRAKTVIPVAVHVSLPYLEMGQVPQDAIAAIGEDACDYFNFNGGIWPCRQLFHAADLYGIPYWHGSEVDLGILEAAYIHKSAAGRCATLPADIFGRLVREHDLLSAPLRIENGIAELPQGPGLGVELDHAALAHYRISSWSTENGRSGT
ncbi:MAG: mandelate racemase/muconate lactonizing enzyme family protein [Bryobacterales bacterium]|nr:mandelate racemase/muconate lactonizing enzyme family protein [Bryobacterales bacterium]